MASQSSLVVTDAPAPGAVAAPRRHVTGKQVTPQVYQLLGEAMIANACARECSDDLLEALDAAT